MQLTRFPNAEKFVGVPTDDAAGQSTPAPFHYAAKGLSVLARAPRYSQGAGVGPTNGSARRNSCDSPAPAYWLFSSYEDLKKLRMKLRAALGSDEGRKGSNRKGMSRAGAG